MLQWEEINNKPMTVLITLSTHLCVIRKEIFSSRSWYLSESQAAASKNPLLLLKGQVLRDCVKPSAHKELLLSPFKLFSLESSPNIFPKPADCNCYRSSWVGLQQWSSCPVSLVPIERDRVWFRSKGQLYSLIDHISKIKHPPSFSFQTLPRIAFFLIKFVS